MHTGVSGTRQGWQVLNVEYRTPTMAYQVLNVEYRTPTTAYQIQPGHLLRTHSFVPSIVRLLNLCLKAHRGSSFVKKKHFIASKITKLTGMYFSVPQQKAAEKRQAKSKAVLTSHCSLL